MALGRPVARTLTLGSRQEQSANTAVGNGVLACMLIAIAFVPLLLPTALAGPAGREWQSMIMLAMVLATGWVRSRWPLAPADHDVELDSALGRAYSVGLTAIAVAILVVPSLLSLDADLSHRVQWLAIPPFAGACVANCYGMRGLRSFRAPLMSSIIAFPPLIEAVGIGATHSWIVLGAVVGFGSIGPAIRTSRAPNAKATQSRRSPELGVVSAMVVAFLLLYR